VLDAQSAESGAQLECCDGLLTKDLVDLGVQSLRDNLNLSASHSYFGEPLMYLGQHRALDRTWGGWTDC
jgi:hypothetical protein